MFFRLGCSGSGTPTFWLCVGFAPTRRLTQAAVHALGSRGVLRLVRHVRPDVIVSVYPMTTEVLGKLRRTGRLDIPVVAAITDLAAMHYWAAPGIDLHLVIHPESIEEVREVAGADSDVQRRARADEAGVREAVRPARGARRARAAAPTGRSCSSRAAAGASAISRARSTRRSRSNVTVVACLCGRNEELRERLRAPLSPTRTGCAWSASRSR